MKPSGKGLGRRKIRVSFRYIRWGVLSYHTVCKIWRNSPTRAGHEVMGRAQRHGAVCFLSHQRRCGGRWQVAGVADCIFQRWSLSLWFWHSSHWEVGSILLGWLLGQTYYKSWSNSVTSWGQIVNDTASAWFSGGTCCWKTGAVPCRSSNSHVEN